MPRLPRLSWSWKSRWWKATIGFFWPLWLGSIVVALVLAVPTYIVTRWAVVRYRKRWHEKHPEPVVEAPASDPTDPDGAGEPRTGDADG